MTRRVSGETGQRRLRMAGTAEWSGAEVPDRPAGAGAARWRGPMAARWGGPIGRQAQSTRDQTRTPVPIHSRGHAVDNRPAMVDATVHNPSESVDEWLPSVEDPLLSVEDVTTISSVHPN